MSPPLEPAVGSQDPSQITTGHQNDIPCLDGDIGAAIAMAASAGAKAGASLMPSPTKATRSFVSQYGAFGRWPHGGLVAVSPYAAANFITAVFSARTEL